MWLQDLPSWGRFFLLKRSAFELNQVTCHILALFHSQPRVRAFRRHLAEHAHLSAVLRGSAAQSFGVMRSLAQRKLKRYPVPLEL